ncbi:head completion/stabilization protein [Chitinivorax sp. B]|uniref:head completion/stabilization protein n=1 Tax=Chitinivorax sp. B TaxID=2502235 RepID=UPI002016D222|nr:head completion/stabilization protein [Chitinivorax sp. B]
MMIQPTTSPPADSLPIQAGSFWPVVTLDQLRKAMRLDGTVTNERLRMALIEAIASVNGDLASWRQRQQAQGFASLATVPAEPIDGQSVLVQRWLRAVYCLAVANVTERYRSFDATGAGHQQADRLDSTVDDLRRDSRWAVTDLLGIGRSTVALI